MSAHLSAVPGMPPLSPEREREVRAEWVEKLVAALTPERRVGLMHHSSSELPLTATPEDGRRYMAGLLVDKLLPDLTQMDRVLASVGPAAQRDADRIVELEAELASRPSRFSATPAEVDRFLRRILAEDTYLHFQWSIGDAAAHEAADDLRREAEAGASEGVSHHLYPGFVRGADFIDPAKGGGHYPSVLLCSEHNGPARFGPCPGAPRCTPRDTEAGGRDDR